MGGKINTEGIIVINSFRFKKGI